MNELGKIFRLGVLCGLLGLLAGWGQARAEETSADVVNELRTRLEALERQNQHLMKLIEGGQVPAAAQPVHHTELADPETVQKIVGDYLKEVDEQKKQAEAAKNPQPDLHIRGDKDVRYEKVAQAMAAAQQAGLRKIGFITEPRRP